ncbi:hypothetical protein I4F81_003271 [Pyropia yezoensis]|uniref:Uncharacterized protein n=1 Tax=Pyropia yezoensis TaxID=2788 RepID=A0ACC3BSX1_PYRYE|nr:hypothetical protein I4F81_003271 [Neopyropia yezoensis]
MTAPAMDHIPSGVHEAACLVKDIIDCTTGRHLAFVCTSCVSPFRHPTLEMDEWLASTATLSQADQDAHRTGAALQKSTNKRCYQTHPTGVVLGECNRCFLRARPRRRVTVAGPVYCQSVRHPRGTSALARYTPAPGILPWLWTAEKAASQAALPVSQRAKGRG